VSLGRYAILVVGVAALALLFVWPLALPRLDAAARRAVLYGGGLAVVNAILAHFLVLWSDRRSTRAFFGAVLGGMVGRMALLLGAVATGILVLELPSLPLAVSLLSFFVLFLVVELGVLHRRRQPVPGPGR